MRGMFEKEITEKICALDSVIVNEFSGYIISSRPVERSLLQQSASRSLISRVRQDLSRTGLGNENQKLWRSRIAFLSLEKRVLEQAAGFKGSGLSVEDWLRVGNIKENKAKALFRSVDPAFFVAHLEDDNGKPLMGANELRRYRDNLMPDCREEGVASISSPHFDGLVVSKLVNEIAEEVEEWDVPYLL